MVAAHGGSKNVIGRPSATGLGVHLIFLSEESPKSTSRPRPRPRLNRGTPGQEEEDVEMADSDVDSSGSRSGPEIDAAEHTQHQEHKGPPSTLDTPKAPRRTEDWRPEEWHKGSVASTDASVMNSPAPITKRWPAPHSDIEDVEAARQRVQEQRLAEAKRFQIEQLWKGAQREAQQLRQRAADLEHETAKEIAQLLQMEMEMNGEGQSRDMLEEDGDGDRFEVQSNRSYTPTEVYSEDDD